MDNAKQISEYIASQILAVISTTNNKGNPEAALIAVTEAENLEMIFGTFNTSRKYKNLRTNLQVAITFGHDVNEAITVQYEGVAQELSGAEAERCKNLHVGKNPRSKKYADKPQQRWFKVKPTWIRYVDLASKPHIEFEMKF